MFYAGGKFLEDVDKKLNIKQKLAIVHTVKS